MDKSIIKYLIHNTSIKWYPAFSVEIWTDEEIEQCDAYRSMHRIECPEDLAKRFFRNKEELLEIQNELEKSYKAERHGRRKTHRADEL